MTPGLGCNLLALLAIDAIGEEDASEEATREPGVRRAEPPVSAPAAEVSPGRADVPVGQFESIIAGSNVSVPPLLGDDAFSIPVAALRQRLGLADHETGAEAACGRLGSAEPVCARYRLDQSPRPGRSDPERAALPVDAVELTIHPAERLESFLDLVTQRWGPPVETRSTETVTSCHNQDCQQITGYPLYHWFDDEAGLGMRVEGVGVYVTFVFYRYLPTARLPEAFAEAVRPHLGTPTGDDVPGAPHVELPPHKWSRPGQPMALLWQAQSTLGGPSIIHSFWRPLRFDAYPGELDTLLQAMADAWGQPRRGCSRNDPKLVALRFASRPPIVAVRENTTVTMWAFDDEARADRELVVTETCRGARER